MATKWQFLLYSKILSVNQPLKNITVLLDIFIVHLVAKIFILIKLVIDSYSSKAIHADKSLKLIKASQAC